MIFHNFKNISQVDQILGEQRESTNKTIRKEVWFDFHIRHRGENIAKCLPPFSKS